MTVCALTAVVAALASTSVLTACGENYDNGAAGVYTATPRGKRARGDEHQLADDA